MSAEIASPEFPKMYEEDLMIQVGKVGLICTHKPSLLEKDKLETF